MWRWLTVLFVWCKGRDCHYASTALSESWGRGRMSTRPMSFSVLSAGTSGMTTSLLDVSVPNISSVLTFPNSAMTASCIFRVATWKLPMETGGKLQVVLVFGWSFLLWRSKWKRQMRMVDKLRSTSQTTYCKPNNGLPVLHRCKNGLEGGLQHKLGAVNAIVGNSSLTLRTWSMWLIQCKM